MSHSFYTVGCVFSFIYGTILHACFSKYQDFSPLFALFALKRRKDKVQQTLLLLLILSSTPLIPAPLPSSASHTFPPPGSAAHHQCLKAGSLPHTLPFPPSLALSRLCRVQHTTDTINCHQALLAQSDSLTVLPLLWSRISP